MWLWNVRRSIDFAFFAGRVWTVFTGACLQVQCAQQKSPVLGLQFCRATQCWAIMYRHGLMCNISDKKLSNWLSLDIAKISTVSVRRSYCTTVQKPHLNRLVLLGEWLSGVPKRGVLGVHPVEKCQKKFKKTKNCRSDTVLNFAHVTSYQTTSFAQTKVTFLLLAETNNADISCTADAAAAELQLWFRQLVAQEAEKRCRCISYVRWWDIASH